MSFSKDVKKYLYEARESGKDCCKASFDAGAKGITAEFGCKKCTAQYIAGVFCEYGTMSDPSKSFQLFVYPKEEVEEFIYSLLEEGVSISSGKIRGKKCFYCKSCESVADFLAFCKATPFAMRVFEEGVVSEERVRLQRKCNAEVANIARTTAAAGEQLEAIKLLRKYGMLETLKSELREAAMLREAHPEEGLSQLVFLSPVAVSKSGLNYRLKKLVSMAEELKSEDK